MHNYLDTADPEVYEYSICWADRDLPFVAELSFFNHTAKGLIYVLLAAVDRETKKHDPASEEKIIRAIAKTLRHPAEGSSSPSVYVQVPIRAQYKLSGTWRFPELYLLIHDGDAAIDASGYVTFPVYSADPVERHYESSHRALQIASTLTMLTQQQISVDDRGPWQILDTNLFHDFLIGRLKPEELLMIQAS